MVVVVVVVAAVVGAGSLGVAGSGSGVGLFFFECAVVAFDFAVGLGPVGELHRHNQQHLQPRRTSHPRPNGNIAHPTLAKPLTRQHLSAARQAISEIATARRSRTDF